MKNLFMGVLVIFAALIITKKAYSANTENYTSPIGTNLSAFNDWTGDWVFVDAFSKSRPWVSSLCSGGWNNGPAMSKDSNGWVSSLVPPINVLIHLFLKTGKGIIRQGNMSSYGKAVANLFSLGTWVQSLIPIGPLQPPAVMELNVQPL